MNNKILTIIVPVYEYVEELVKCIRAVDPTNINLVIVDDGTTKNIDSLNYILSRCCRYPHIKIVRTEHKGTWNARLEGLKHVHTPYFTFCDGDDITFSKNQIELCEKMEEFDVKYGVGSLLLSFNKVLCGKTRKREQFLDFENKPEDLSYLLNSVCNKIYSEELISQFQTTERNLNVFEDAVAPYYLAAVSKKGIVTNKPIYHYKMHSDSFFFKNSDNLSSNGLKNLYLSGECRNEAFNKIEQYFKYEEALDSITIRLFFQRIFSIYGDRRIRNKEDLVNIVFQMLSKSVPNWDKNSFYLQNFYQAEWNDVLNFVMARMTLLQQRKILNFSIYLTDKNIDNLCEEYDKNIQDQLLNRKLTSFL